MNIIVGSYNIIFNKFSKTWNVRDEQGYINEHFDELDDAVNFCVCG